MSESDRWGVLQDALKRSAAALRAAEVPFAVTGSAALWVHGAPPPTHDVDLAVAEQDVEAAAEALTAAGFAVERPPEEWLFKARPPAAAEEAEDGTGTAGELDVLHRLNGEPITAEQVAAAQCLDVLGVHMPVMAAATVVVAKLRSLSEHYCDFAALLPVVRAVREQLDWDRIRVDTADNDFAAAFLFLAGRLGLTG